MVEDLTKADYPTMGHLTTWYVKCPPKPHLCPRGVVGEYIDRCIKHKSIHLVQVQDSYIMGSFYFVLLYLTKNSDLFTRNFSNFSEWYSSYRC